MIHFPDGAPPLSTSSSIVDSEAIRAAVAEWTLAFLESLKSGTGTREWIALFRDSLAGLLGVDRVSVDVNVAALRRQPPDADRALAISHTFDDDGAYDPTVRLDAQEATGTPASHAERFIDAMSRGGFTIHDYNPPLAEEYFDESGTYLGTILVWKRTSPTPIGERTLQLLDAAAAVIRSLFIDCAARHQSREPVNDAFYHALDELATEARLTPAQHHVVTREFNSEVQHLLPKAPSPPPLIGPRVQFAGLPKSLN